MKTGIRLFIATLATLALLGAACAQDTDTADQALSTAQTASSSAEDAMESAEDAMDAAGGAQTTANAAAAAAEAAAAAAEEAKAEARAAKAQADVAAAEASGNTAQLEEARAELAAAQEELQSAQDATKDAQDRAEELQKQLEEVMAMTEPTGEDTTMSKLTDVCPNPLIIQTDWFPEPEHGHTYQLVGVDGEIDAENGTYSGEYKDTGLMIEIRAGGPYIGFSPPNAQFYADDDIFLAYVDTAAAIRSYGTTPVVAVFTSFEAGPQILMWDPDDYDFESFEEIGESGATVLYFGGATYMDYLVNKGILNEDQIDGSYDGSPTRFITEDGLVQQGFATNEPYRYENEIEGWMKPVDFLLIHDAPFEIYQSAISARVADVTAYQECLELFVPIMQQAHVDYANDPGPINVRLDEIVKALDSFWTSSIEGHNEASRAMIELGLVTDGDNDYVGDMDADRIQNLIDELKPIFEEQGVESFDSTIIANDIFTNEFLDTSIGLGF